MCHSFFHDCLRWYSSYQSWVPLTSVGLWGSNLHASETRIRIILGGIIKVLPKKEYTYLSETGLTDKEIFVFLIWNSHIFFLTITNSAGEIVNYLFEYWRKIKGTSRQFIPFDAVWNVKIPLWQNALNFFSASELDNVFLIFAEKWMHLFS